MPSYPISISDPIVRDISWTGVSANGAILTDLTPPEDTHEIYIAFRHDDSDAWRGGALISYSIWNQYGVAAAGDTLDDNNSWPYGFNLNVTGYQWRIGRGTNGVLAFSSSSVTLVVTRFDRVEVRYFTTSDETSAIQHPTTATPTEPAESTLLYYYDVTPLSEHPPAAPVVRAITYGVLKGFMRAGLSISIAHKLNTDLGNVDTLDAAQQQSFRDAIGIDDSPPDAGAGLPDLVAGDSGRLLQVNHTPEWNKGFYILRPAADGSYPAILGAYIGNAILVDGDQIYTPQRGYTHATPPQGTWANVGGTISQDSAIKPNFRGAGATHQQSWINEQSNNLTQGKFVYDWSARRFYVVAMNNNGIPVWQSTGDPSDWLGAFSSEEDALAAAGENGQWFFNYTNHQVRYLSGFVPGQSQMPIDEWVHVGASDAASNAQDVIGLLEFLADRFAVSGNLTIMAGTDPVTGRAILTFANTNPPLPAVPTGTAHLIMQVDLDSSNPTHREPYWGAHPVTPFSTYLGALYLALKDQIAVTGNGSISYDDNAPRLTIDITGGPGGNTPENRLIPSGGNVNNGYLGKASNNDYDTQWKTFPVASQTHQGISRYASDADAVAGTIGDRIVSPATMHWGIVNHFIVDSQIPTTQPSTAPVDKVPSVQAVAEALSALNLSPASTITIYQTAIEGVSTVTDSSAWRSLIGLDGITPGINIGNFTKVEESNVWKVVIPEAGYYQVDASISFHDPSNASGNRRASIYQRLTIERAGESDIYVYGGDSAYLRQQYDEFKDSQAHGLFYAHLEVGDKIRVEQIARTAGDGFIITGSQSLLTIFALGGRQGLQGQRGPAPTRDRVEIASVTTEAIHDNYHPNLSSFINAGDIVTIKIAGASRTTGFAFFEADELLEQQYEPNQPTNLATAMAVPVTFPANSNSGGVVVGKLYLHKRTESATEIRILSLTFRDVTMVDGYTIKVYKSNF